MVWLALNDKKAEGKYEWMGQSRALTYSNWHTCAYDPDGDWKEIKNKFSHGYVSVVKYTKDAAKKLCDENPACKAVTCGEGCTLRTAEILTNSPAGKIETTYIRQAC